MKKWKLLLFAAKILEMFGNNKTTSLQPFSEPATNQGWKSFLKRTTNSPSKRKNKLIKQHNTHTTPTINKYLTSNRKWLNDKTKILILTPHHRRLRDVPDVTPTMTGVEDLARLTLLPLLLELAAPAAAAGAAAAANEEDDDEDDMVMDVDVKGDKKVAPYAAKWPCADPAPTDGNADEANAPAVAGATPGGKAWLWLWLKLLLWPWPPPPAIASAAP